MTDPDALARCLAKPDKTSATGECLHTAVSGLLSVMSARTLLAYTDATTSPIEVLRNCHAVGHIIGEETFKRSDTLEAALSSCSTACRSACLHGALGAGVLAQLGEEYAGEDIVHADNATIERIGGPYCAKSAQLCHGIDITVNITIKEKI